MPIGTPTSIGSNSNTGNVTSITITTSAAIVAGNLAIVGVAFYNGNVVTISSVSDGTNTYSQALFVTDATTNLTSALWYKANAAAVSSGASLVITFSFIVSNSFGGVFAAAAQVSGIAMSSPLDSAGATGTAESVSSISVTTGTLAQASEILFGVSNVRTTGTTITDGYTNLYNSGVNANEYAGILGYKIVSSTAAVTYNPSANSSTTYWASVNAPFKGVLASIPNKLVLVKQSLNRSALW
jgi:hypothetical protein